MLGLLKITAKLAIILILAVYFLIWILSPYVTRHYISELLDPQQLKLVDESIVRYNPFLSKLTVENFSIARVINNSQSLGVFSLADLTLEVSAYRLLFDQLSVTEFDISDLHVVISRETNNEEEKKSDVLTIAGFNIPISQQSSSEKVTTEDVSQPETTVLANDFFLQLLMDRMTLSNSSIVFIENGQQHRLELSSVNLKAVEASQLKQSFTLDLRGNLNGASIEVAVATELENGLGHLNIETKIEDIDINKFKYLSKQHLDDMYGLVSYQAVHQINVMEDFVSIDVVDLDIISKNLVAIKKSLSLELEKQEFKSKQFNIIVKKDSLPQLSGKGHLVFEDLKVYNQDKDQVLVSMKEMGFDTIHMSSEQGQYEINIDNIMTLDTFFSDNTDNILPALSQFSSLGIKDVVLTNTGMEIDTVEFSGLKSNLQLDEKKVLKNLIVSVEELSSLLGFEQGQVIEEFPVDDVVLDKSKDLSKSDISSEKSKVDTGFSIKLNTFRLADDANIYFSDLSVAPHYKRNVFLTNFSAGPFDTQRPELNSVIAIKGKSNQYDNFDIKVDAKPFLAIPTYVINSKIKEVHLTDLSGYIKQALGYEIDSGHLDLDIQVELIGTEIQGDSQILLRGIQLTSVDDHESGSLNEATSIPFNLALGMLKDSDGNVDLNLPLSGDTSSPSFGLSGFLTLVVKRATIAAAKEYLTMTFVPYAGLVKVVLAADDYLLKIEINDLEFKEKETDMPNDEEEFLSNFAALLIEKPDLQVKLCGVSSLVDLGVEKRLTDATPEDIQKLLSLSELRAVNFKQYMVEEKNITSSRLLLCKPKVDLSNDAIPHLKFEI